MKKTVLSKLVDHITGPAVLPRVQDYTIGTWKDGTVEEKKPKYFQSLGLHTTIAKKLINMPLCKKSVQGFSICITKHTGKSPSANLVLLGTFLV